MPIFYVLVPMHPDFSYLVFKYKENPLWLSFYVVNPLPFDDRRLNYNKLKITIIIEKELFQINLQTRKNVFIFKNDLYSSFMESITKYLSWI